jgi:metal transporter CNNM
LSFVIYKFYEVLTSFAGIVSGLTVGYLSIDELVLEIKQKTGSESVKKNCNSVIPVLKNKHWLLVTLLVANAGANEALPLFLGRLVPEYLAVIFSVTLVLIFGEVIPQAFCTGPNQIQIAAKLSCLTRSLMWISSPISYPISLLLDCMFGKHSKSR